MKKDIEIESLQKIIGVLNVLDHQAQDRIVKYLVERIIRSRNPQPVVEKPQENKPAFH